MNAEQFFNNGFGADVEKVHRKQVIDLMTNFAKHYHTEQCNIADVVCSCYMCGKSIEQPEEQYDMYGEMVCQDCWDYNIYQALQDGGGM